MVKKTKTSQRRKNKKGDKLSSDVGANSSSSVTDDTFAHLPEDHTIADSVSTFQSLQDEFQDDDNEIIPDVTQEASRHSKLVDALNIISDITSEKRSSKREQYLRSVFKALTQYTSSNTSKEYVILKIDDIIPSILYSLRNTSSSPAEQYAACRCLEALSILLGYGNDEYIETIYAPLQKAIKSTGLAVQVRLAALRALSLSYFICGTDITEMIHCMDFCELVCAEKFRGEKVHDLLRASAIECWTLLATVLDDSDLSGDAVISHTYHDNDDDDHNENDDEVYNNDEGKGIQLLPLFQKYLEESNSMELKSACGEAIALIHESRLDLGIADEKEGNSTQRRFQRGSWDGSEHEFIIDELRQLVTDLALTTGHHMSKKAKKEQRATFREIQYTLVDDEPPSESINIGSTTLDLTSWREIIQLSFIRHCLQTGFQTQLLTNSTLWNIFGLDGQQIMANQGMSGNGMSQFEKRMIMGKTSEAAKAADQNLVKKRRNRNQAKHSFLNADY